ncbi:MAG TPA: SAF domain-containing protein, partial [Kofleriaceae bacterium]|nr:SAF domain-containing protein [Kofleriaceae bacterium]
MKALLFTAFAAAGAAAAVAPRAAAAEPLAEVARAQIEATLPADLGIVEVHLTPRLAALDVDPAVVTAEWTRPPRAGTASVKLAWGKPSRFVPVTLAAVAAVPVAVRDLAPGEPITAADVSIEERPLAAGATFAAQPVGQTATTAIAAGSIIGAGAVTRPAPIPRGTAVRVEV